MRKEDGVDIAGLNAKEPEIVKQSAADDAALLSIRDRDTDQSRARSPGEVDPGPTFPRYARGGRQGSLRGVRHRLDGRGSQPKTRRQSPDRTP